MPAPRRALNAAVSESERGAWHDGTGGSLHGDLRPPVHVHPEAQVRSGQVRFITRPKSRTVRATRQLMLPPKKNRDLKEKYLLRPLSHGQELEPY